MSRPHHELAPYYVMLLLALLACGCAARTRRAQGGCTVPGALGGGMLQEEVLASPGFESPVIVGQVRVSSSASAQGVYDVGIWVSHGKDMHAAKVGWLYAQDQQRNLWTLVEFEDHRVVSVRCARIVRPEEVR